MVSAGAETTEYNDAYCGTAMKQQGKQQRPLHQALSGIGGRGGDCGAGGR